MQYTIYSTEVADSAFTKEQSEAFAKVYAEALKAEFKETGYDIAVEVRHNVSGYSNELKGCENPILADGINALAEVVWEREMENFFAV